MKSKVQKTACAVLTALLIWLMVSGLGYIVRPVSTDEVYSQVETLHSLRPDSVDVMIYGSSHAYRGVSPAELRQQYGISAYNYAWNWQHINTTNLFLKDSLESQTPRLALIECFMAGSVLQDEDISAEINYTRFLHNRKARADYLRQCFGSSPERYLSFYMPLCAFHENWNTLEEKSFQKLETEPWLRETMGFLAIDDVAKVEIPDCRAFRQEPLSEAAEAEILDIIETCREKGTQVLFFTIPWEGEFTYSEALRTIARENGCGYLDLFESAEEIGLDGKTDFADAGHVNTSGAIKISDYLGQYIVDHYPELGNGSPKQKPDSSVQGNAV